MSSYANTKRMISSCDGEGIRFTLRKICHHVPRVAVRIFLIQLATVTIVLSRTRDRRARNETFGISGGTKIRFQPIPLEPPGKTCSGRFSVCHSTVRSREMRK